ncbi:MAG: chloride channel protein family [Acidobacteriaceae bacterium]|jgi:CIC family chloride channel protein|nr:chloride channel protein family [Acidobacteriaceae bacterium]MDX6460928.1 chloride channel protein family [Acidobacteriaceae bacterium]MEA2264134.1 chloride channel protein family [Acidobacteriaceae bacterium]
MNWRAKAFLAFGDLLWAMALGLTSSLACVVVRLFFRLLQWLVTGHSGLLAQAAEGLPPWYRVITPAFGALAAMAVVWAARRFAKSGNFEEYVQAVRLHGGRIAFLPTLWITISSAFSVATGAAIGREGSMIQFATATTSWLGEHAALSRIPLPTQVACGAAAAVATVYHAPIAGVFFAAEIVMGRIMIRTIPLLLVSALTGGVTGAWLLGGGPLFAIRMFPGMDFGIERSTICAVLLPVLMGLLGPAYYWLTRSLRNTSRLPLPLLWGGVLVGVLSLSSTLVWGNGDAALLQITQSSPAAWTLFSILVLRLCATTLCVGTGTVGGVFTPTIFAGGAIGYLGAHLLHMPSPLFTILSMGCLLAAVTHAPLMASFMAVELTGQWSLLPYILLGSVIAWTIARMISPHSLYAIATPEPAGEALESNPPTAGRRSQRKRPAVMETVGAGQ